MKTSAPKTCNLVGNTKDEGNGDWIYVNDTDDLFRHNVDVDFNKLKFDPINFYLNSNNDEMVNLNVILF